MEVNPDAARQRREHAAKQARVERWTELSGNAGLAGRELPSAQVLAADQRVTAWAKELGKAGLAGGMDYLRARAYLDLLLGTDSRPQASPGPDSMTADGPGPDGGDPEGRGSDDPPARDLDRPHGARPFVFVSSVKSPSGRARRRRHLAAEQVEHRHSHRQPVGHLIEDRGIRPVGDLGGQLDPAIDRPRRQQQNVRFGATQALAVHAEQAEVFLNGRKQTASLPLELDAQNIDHVAQRQDVV